MATACGKVILLGEHAVVYGVPAIAAGIERGARATAERTERASLSVGATIATQDDGSDLGRALGALLDALDVGTYAIDVETELPVGRGLGSSAAIAVAAARAVLEAAGEPASDVRVLAAALAWERVFHGNPSGIDTAAAADGGCILVPARPRARAASTWAHPWYWPSPSRARPRAPRAWWRRVARIAERRPDVFEKSLDGMSSLVKNARLAIEAGDVVGLGRLLDLNQMLLAGLHVSSEEIERACQLARAAGALGAKLTGAGGGGAVIALHDGGPDRRARAWRRPTAWRALPRRPADAEARAVTRAARATAHRQHRAGEVLGQGRRRRRTCPQFPASRSRSTGSGP